MVSACVLYHAVPSSCSHQIKHGECSSDKHTTGRTLSLFLYGGVGYHFSLLPYSKGEWPTQLGFSCLGVNGKSNRILVHKFLLINLLGILLFPGSSCKVAIYRVVVPVSESLSYRNIKQCFADGFPGNIKSFGRDSVVPQKWHWTGGRRNLFVNHCFE